MQFDTLLPQTKPDTMSRERAHELCDLLAGRNKPWNTHVLTPVNGPGQETELEFEVRCAADDEHGLRHIVLALLRHHPDVLLIERASPEIHRVLNWVIEFLPLHKALPTGRLVKVVTETIGGEWLEADGGLCLMAVVRKLWAIPGCRPIMVAHQAQQQALLEPEGQGADHIDVLSSRLSQDDLDVIFGDPHGIYAVMGYLSARRQQGAKGWHTDRLWVLDLLAEMSPKFAEALRIRRVPGHRRGPDEPGLRVDPAKVAGSENDLVRMLGFLLQDGDSIPYRERLNWALMDIVLNDADPNTGSRILSVMSDVDAGVIGYPTRRRFSPETEASIAEIQAAMAGESPAPVRAARAPGDPHGAERCQHLWLGDDPELVASLPEAIAAGMVEPSVQRILEEIRQARDVEASRSSGSAARVFGVLSRMVSRVTGGQKARVRG